MTNFATALLLMLLALSTSPAFCDSIHDAARNGDLAKVQELLKADPAMVSWKDSTGATALHWAAVAGHKDVVELLLANKADVSAIDKVGMTPLSYAAANGHKDLVELLLANKADVNDNSNQGETPAPPANPLAQLFINASPGSNSKPTQGVRPLEWAVMYGHWDVAQLLLANKADVNSKDNIGQTALHYAAASGHMDVTQLLLANKADVNAKDDTGKTPLHHAAVLGHKEVGELLLANKADVNAKDNIGETPLHLAAASGHMDMAELLLGNHAEVDLKNHDGGSPLHFAAAFGHQDVAGLLLANHAEVNARDNDGETPLSSALAMSHNDIAAFLRQHGAISKPNDAALRALSKFLRKAYFVPNHKSLASALDIYTPATYRKDKSTYYKSFASIDDDGYTFELNQALAATLVGVTVGQGVYKPAWIPNFAPLGGAVRVKFADVTRIKTERGGLEVHLLGGRKELDSFWVLSGSQRDVREALRVLCPNAEWK